MRRRETKKNNSVNCFLVEWCADGYRKAKPLGRQAGHMRSIWSCRAYIHQKGPLTAVFFDEYTLFVNSWGQKINNGIFKAIAKKMQSP